MTQVARAAAQQRHAADAHPSVPFILNGPCAPLMPAVRPRYPVAGPFPTLFKTASYRFSSIRLRVTGRGMLVKRLQPA